MTSKALVVLSGGADSTICLGWALTQFEEVACITFHYGQRHKREIEAACAVVAYFEGKYGHKIPHEVLELPDDTLRSTSPLTDPGAELETYPDHDTMAGIIGDRVEKTFVPMRNTLFLTLAANRAVAMGPGTTLVTGVCQEDNANYPDCTVSFIRAIGSAFQESLGVYTALNINTPLMTRSKADSVRLALSLPYTYGALAFSHTAYDGAYPPVGRDHASVLRAHGFEQAQVPDPLVLRAVWEGAMPLPKTHNYHAAEGYIADLCPDWPIVKRDPNPMAIAVENFS